MWVKMVTKWGDEMHLVMEKLEMNYKELKMVMLMVLAFEWMFHETACANNKKQKQI